MINETKRLKSKIVWWSFFLNPLDVVSRTFKVPETKNGQRFEFSNFFKLETCKNLYKFFLLQLILIMGPIFLLYLHYKKANFEILYV